MRVVAVVLACCSLLAAPTLAQVTAKSEAPPEDPGKKFRSPMVLDISVPGVVNIKREQAKGKDYQVNLLELVGYECDGVVLASAGGTASIKDFRGTAALDVALGMEVRPGIDKFVEIRAELLVNGRPIGADCLLRIDAEERKKARADLSIPFRANMLPTGVTPILHLIITVADNP